ncbi:MAG: hypothetical protein BECKG1743D_GA0114223_100072 [Candidatus Kentron sp. G]|nr:MAG: hypothetical protein BECKG1743F_GA0114225_100062 [Candidatus Kentron sp. G]VFM95565.1 MAG: hypothetical protein BECKG1743E_GA0114224_100072 [Candidatus Kentron sp. G]VFM97264.1 MAG: hypothetical protein BECKG1743D_GA0114223_100072 [Candidatus Kentron sp. G]
MFHPGGWKASNHLGDWQIKNIPNRAGFSFGFKAHGRRIVHYVTVIATQKLDDKDKQVGIFFDRNRLSIQRGKPQRVSWSFRDRYRYRYSLSEKPDKIDSEPVPYGNGCMKSVHKKQEMDGL